MLTINNKQMNELNRRFNERYEALAVAHLSEKYPEWAVAHGQEGVRAFVSDGVTRAEKLRIVESQDVTVFLQYNVVLGPGFERTEDHEWAAGILHIRNLSGIEKIIRMQEAYPLP